MNYETTISDSESVEGWQDDAARRGSARKRNVLIGIVALLALVGIWFAINRGEEAEGALTDNKQDEQAPVVSVAAPGRATIEGEINVNGTLAARRELPVGVPGEGGQVMAVLVEPGQWVGAGQVLAVIDRSVQVQQQASQAAQIEVARANARLAQANLDRALKLVDRGFVSRADIDRLTATRDSANAQVGVANAQLGVIRAQVRRLNVIAPSAGLVLERRVEPGQIVSAGSGVLFRLAKGGEMELKALVGETELAQIATGVSANVTPVGTAKQFTGQVWQISPVIDPATRQGIARIALAYAPELRPGGFATVTIKSGTLVAPVLPESAVLSDSKGSYVYVIGSDNKAARRDVRTGAIVDSGVVIAQGLTGSERVVLRSGGFLQPGETVKPVLPKP
jgi:RND family efflux transporter MFP subunit